MVEKFGEYQKQAPISILETFSLNYPPKAMNIKCSATNKTSPHSHYILYNSMTGYWYQALHKCQDCIESYRKDIFAGRIAGEESKIFKDYKDNQRKQNIFMREVARITHLHNNDYERYVLTFADNLRSDEILKSVEKSFRADGYVTIRGKISNGYDRLFLFALNRHKAKENGLRQDMLAEIIDEKAPAGEMVRQILAEDDYIAPIATSDLTLNLEEYVRKVRS